MSRRVTRSVAVLAALTLVPGLAAWGGSAGSGGTAAQAAPRNDGYTARIVRTTHGIPHVIADDWGSLGFGNGYATAETSICNLADTVLTARGQRSRYLGPEQRYVDHVTLDATNLQVDTLFTDIRNRRVVEKLLADRRRGPGSQTRAMVRGYAAGVNAYLRDIGGSRNITDPACQGAAWVRPNATAKDIWYAVYAANLLASSGVFVPQIADAAPPSDLGSATGATAGHAAPPRELPDRDALLTGLGKDPDNPFGSNATAVGRGATTTGRGMVLGNPHFPWRGRYRFIQTHLTIPGRYDVAGAGLIGSPVVNIGWNKDVAWSHTVSTAYRFTPYEYRTVPGTTRYTTSSGEVKEPVRRTVEVEVTRPDGSIGKISEDVWRTDEGYVLDAERVLMPWTPTSFWALRDANAEHLRTVDTFHLMARATSVRDLLRRQDKGAGMPWVNTTAADRSGEVLYADHSVVPHVSDDMAAACKTPVGNVLDELAGLPGLDGNRADGECAWGSDDDASRPGVFGPRNLPHTFRKDWVINANDSYWLPNPEKRLEGFARIIGCEECERSLRQRVVYRYVMDRLAGKDRLAKGDRVSHRTLKLFQHENRVFGGELAAKNGDLVTVCETAGGGDTCGVLAKWDGRSDTDSVGTHVFQEFWKRAKDIDSPVWEVPFDPAKPISTPRDLDEDNPEVVEAMRDALAFLAERGVDPATQWGRLQVAGDEGAPPLPIGGGEGYAGNANAVASRLPATNLERLYPLSYGSSHIQAVAFKDGGLAAHTILTYGQSVDPTRRTSQDQTRLFSQERWVEFPWTDAEIRRSKVRSYLVRGR